MLFGVALTTGEGVVIQGAGCSPVDDGERVRPRSGGLVDSPLFSNMARRFLTWLMLAVHTAVGVCFGFGFGFDSELEPKFSRAELRRSDEQWLTATRTTWARLSHSNSTEADLVQG